MGRRKQEEQRRQNRQNFIIELIFLITTLGLALKWQDSEEAEANPWLRLGVDTILWSLVRLSTLRLLDFPMAEAAPIEPIEPDNYYSRMLVLQKVREKTTFDPSFSPEEEERIRELLDKAAHQWLALSDENNDWPWCTLSAFAYMGASLRVVESFRRSEDIIIDGRRLLRVSCLDVAGESVLAQFASAFEAMRFNILELPDNDMHHIHPEDKSCSLFKVTSADSKQLADNVFAIYKHLLVLDKNLDGLGTFQDFYPYLTDMQTPNASLISSLYNVSVHLVRGKKQHPFFLADSGNPISLYGALPRNAFNSTSPLSAPLAFKALTSLFAFEIAQHYGDVNWKKNLVKLKTFASILPASIRNGPFLALTHFQSMAAKDLDSFPVENQDFFSVVDSKTLVRALLILQGAIVGYCVKDNKKRIARSLFGILLIFNLVMGNQRWTLDVFGKFGDDYLKEDSLSMCGFLLVGGFGWEALSKITDWYFSPAKINEEIKPAEEKRPRRNPLRTPTPLQTPEVKLGLPPLPPPKAPHADALELIKRIRIATAHWRQAHDWVQKLKGLKPQTGEKQENQLRELIRQSLLNPLINLIAQLQQAAVGDFPKFVFNLNDRHSWETQCTELESWLNADAAKCRDENRDPLTPPASYKAMLELFKQGVEKLKNKESGIAAEVTRWKPKKHLEIKEEINRRRALKLVPEVNAERPQDLPAPAPARTMRAPAPKSLSEPVPEAGYNPRASTNSYSWPSDVKKSRPDTTQLSDFIDAAFYRTNLKKLENSLAAILRVNTTTVDDDAAKNNALCLMIVWFNEMFPQLVRPIHNEEIKKELTRFRDKQLYPLRINILDSHYRLKLSENKQTRETLCLEMQELGQLVQKMLRLLQSKSLNWQKLKECCQDFVDNGIYRLYQRPAPRAATLLDADFKQLSQQFNIAFVEKSYGQESEVIWRAAGIFAVAIWAKFKKTMRRAGGTPELESVLADISDPYSNEVRHQWATSVDGFSDEIDRVLRSAGSDYHSAF